MRLWDPSNEAFGMTGPGGLKGPPALLQHALGSIVMDVVRGEHRDPAMAMFGVVPREERSAEGDRGGDVVEAAREAGVVLQGLELGLGEGVVVGHLRAAVVKPPPARRSGSVAGVTGACVCDGWGLNWLRVG